MEIFVHELESATDFVRQLFAEQEIILDYSVESIHHLDNLFEQEFVGGILRNGAGVFAQYQGLIMTGVSGYIAEVILRHTENVQLSFDEQDENWFINFAIESGCGKRLMPGHHVLNRAYNGNEDLLYSFVTKAIVNFKISSASPYFKPFVFELPDFKNIKGRHWWKLW